MWCMENTSQCSCSCNFNRRVRSSGARLRMRNRKDLRTMASSEPGSSGISALLAHPIYTRTQLRQCRFLKEAAQRQFHAEYLADARHHLRGQQRVSTQLKKAGFAVG